MGFSWPKTRALALIAGSSLLLVGGLLGCTRGVVGGNPTLAAAGSTETEVGAAITNAFDGLGYHDMLLVPIDPTIPFTVPPSKVVTNGFELLHGLQVASTVPLENGKSLPYDADFYITVGPGPSNRTTVTVRTIHATLRDGQEQGIHGGWAIHQRAVTPVQREEDNVLTAISDQLKKRK